MIRSRKFKWMTFVGVFIGLFMSVFVASVVAKEDTQNVWVDNFGRYIGKFATHCNGKNGETSSYLLKTINGNASGGKYKTNLMPGFLHTYVMNSFMINSNNQNRGFGQTKQGTTNEINNSGSAGYQYALLNFRQFEWDTTYETFGGTWSPDQW